MNPNDITFNAEYLQVYSTPAGLSTITTYCEVNTAFTPPLVTNLTPIDDSPFDGKPLDQYVQVIATGQIIRVYQTPATGVQGLTEG